MVNQMKCDPACLQKTRWDRINPLEFAGGRCGCVFPVTPGAVVDFAAEDFSVIEMEEWMNIHENAQEVIEEIDMTELAGDETKETPEKTKEPVVPEKETKTPAEETKTPAETPVVPVVATAAETLGLFTK